MSKKSTKIIAVAGVVAGLGVAALPALTFAEGEQTVSGQVQVRADVLPAIAMTITGNNDVSPNTAGGVNVYTPANTASVMGHTGGREYDSSALETSGSKTSILPNAVSTASDFKSTITVYTNAVAGYTLTLIDGDTTNALENGSNTIPATSATSLTAGTPAWGYKVGSTATDWLAVPISSGTAADIKTDGASVQGGEATEVYYGVATAAAQATGSYTDTIVYTATTK